LRDAEVVGMSSELQVENYDRPIRALEAFV
jgi:hypothetical protein